MSTSPHPDRELTSIPVCCILKVSKELAQCLSRLGMQMGSGKSEQQELCRSKPSPPAPSSSLFSSSHCHGPRRTRPTSTFVHPPSPQSSLFAFRPHLLRGNAYRRRLASPSPQRKHPTRFALSSNCTTSRDIAHQILRFLRVCIIHEHFIAACFIHGGTFTAARRGVRGGAGQAEALGPLGGWRAPRAGSRAGTKRVDVRRWAPPTNYVLAYRQTQLSQRTYILTSVYVLSWFFSTLIKVMNVRYVLKQNCQGRCHERESVARVPRWNRPSTQFITPPPVTTPSLL